MTFTSAVSYSRVVGFKEPLFAQMPENELLTAADAKFIIERVLRPNDPIGIIKTRISF